MEFSFENITKIIKKNLLILLAAGLAFFGVSYAYMKFLVPPTYSATAKFYIKDATATTSPGQSTTNITNTRLLAETFVEILNTDMFFGTVDNNLASDPTTKKLSDKYDAKSLHSASSFRVVNNTEIISVTFSSKDKDSVIPVINATIGSLQSHLENAYGECNVHIVEMPANATRSNSKSLIISVLFAAIGIFIALAIFVIRDIFDVHIKTVSDITERYNVPILGAVPEFDVAAFKSKNEAKKDATQTKSEVK